MKIQQTLATLCALIIMVSCGNQNKKYDASGLFESTEVIVSAQASGQIMSFYLEEGTLLEQVQQVGYIDTVQLHLKKRQLEANLKAVDSRRSNVPTQVAAIKQQIIKQQQELSRFKNLLKSNAATQKQVDDIQAQIAVLEKQLTAQTELLQNSNTSIYGEYAALEIQIAQIADQLKKSLITSPIEGTVLSKYAEAGEMAAQGKALFKLADLQHMFLRAYITADQITQMKMGQEVKVFADFGEKEMREYKGVVTWVSDKAEFTPKTIQTRNERANLVYAVKIAVENDGYLKQGMYGEVQLGIRN